jgi:hypothetical protein
MDNYWDALLQSPTFQNGSTPRSLSDAAFEAGEELLGEKSKDGFFDILQDVMEKPDPADYTSGPTPSFALVARLPSDPLDLTPGELLITSDERQYIHCSECSQKCPQIPDLFGVCFECSNQPVATQRLSPDEVQPREESPSPDPSPAAPCPAPGSSPVPAPGPSPAGRRRATSGATSRATRAAGATSRATRAAGKKTSRATSGSGATSGAGPAIGSSLSAGYKPARGRGRQPQLANMTKAQKKEDQERRRERNRVCAHEARKRKKLFHAALEQQAAELEQKLQAQDEEIASLQSQIAHLKRLKGEL